MIQGHALDVLLAPVHRDGAFFSGWLFLRGLTAPLFFTLSGASFAISSMRYWEEYSRLSARTGRRLGRFLFFLFLGYLMHLPANTIGEFQYVTASGWQSWFQVDVLQCIALTLAALQLLLPLSGHPAAFARLCAALCALVVLLTPAAWAVQWSRWLPPQLAPYLNSQTGSLFPLFPWSGFVFFGATAGYLLRKRPGLLNVPAMLAAAGLFLCGCALLAAQPAAALYPAADFWRTSPAAFLLRSGCICILLAGFAWISPRLTALQPLCRAVAQESLLIYFVHLCLLYGSVWNLDFNLRQIVGPTLSPLQTAAWILPLALAMLVLGWSWNWLKRAEPFHSSLLRLAVFALAMFRLWPG